MTPWADGWSPPPESPWRQRKTISCGRLVAIPQAIDAAVKTTTQRRM